MTSAAVRLLPSPETLTADEYLFRRFPEVALEDLAESLVPAVDREDEGLVFVGHFRDGDSQSCHGGTEVEEGFVGDHQLGAVQFDQADLDGPLDVFLGHLHAGETFDELFG